MSPTTKLPVLTLILIAANIFGAFALVWQPELVNQFGFNTAAPSIQTVFTNLFLHQNVFHLAGNMIFLAAVGAAVELSTGSLRFAIVYFVSGVVGVLVHWLFAAHQPDPQPLIGASGAVAGCAGYYSVRYVQLRVPLAPKFGVSVALVTVIWLALQIVGAMVRLGDSQGGVSFWAHIGGFGAGLILCAFFRAPDLGHLKLGHSVLEQMNERGPAASAMAARRHLERHQDDLMALRQLATASRSIGDEEGEGDALLKIIDLVPEREQPEPLVRIRALKRLKDLPSLRRILLAERFKESEPELCRVLLESVIEEPYEETQRPDAMLALAAMEREQDPDSATAMLSRLEHEYPLHAAVDLARKRGWLS